MLGRAIVHVSSCPSWNGAARHSGALGQRLSTTRADARKRQQALRYRASRGDADGPVLSSKYAGCDEGFTMRVVKLEECKQTQDTVVTGELLSDDEVLIGRKAISTLDPIVHNHLKPLLRPGVVLRCVAPCDLFAAPGARDGAEFVLLPSAIEFSGDERRYVA